MLSAGSSAPTSSLTTVAKTTAAVASGAHAYLHRSGLFVLVFWVVFGLSGVRGCIQNVAAAGSGGDADACATPIGSPQARSAPMLVRMTCSPTSRWCASGSPVLCRIGHETG